MHALPASYRLGFLGAGQLARMSALEAFKLGIQVVSYASSKGQEPLECVTPHQHKGSFDDTEALLRFARDCSVITLENEFLDSGLLNEIQQKSGTPIFPSPETFRLIESKLVEKNTFQKAGIPVAPFALVRSEEDFKTFGDTHGWPFILKSSKGGYDGYGNALVGSLEEAIQAFSKLGGSKGHDILAEAFIPFEGELSVTVARNHTGIAVFPCVETIHENHILQKVVAPATVSAELQKKAQETAITAIEAIDGVGVFTFEFFHTKYGTLLLNESAPRPHNSAHYTMEACNHSQFALHVRAVLGLPLPTPEMVAPAAVMINILGTQNRPALIENIHSCLQKKRGYVHIYGKADSKKGRKMGHFTLLGDDGKKLLTEADACLQNIEM